MKRPAFPVVVRLCGAAIALAGLTVLVGWCFDVPALGTLGAPATTVKANTALSFVLLGVAMNLLAAGPADASRGRRRLVALLTTAVLAVAGASLLEDITGRALGIDELLVRDRRATLTPGRMAPNTAVAFLFGGGALLAIVTGRPGRGRAIFAGIAAVLTAMLGVLSLSGYISHVAIGYGWGQYTGMALPTAVLLLILGLGGLLAAWEASGRSWHTPGWLVGGIAAGGVVTVALGTLSYLATQRLDELTDEVRHANQVSQALHDTGVRVAQLQTTVRDFVLNGTPEARAAVAASEQRVDDAVAELRRLVANTPAQEIRGAAFARLLDLRRAAGHRAVRLREEAGIAAASGDSADGLIARTMLLVPIATFCALGLFVAALFYLNAEVSDREQAEQRRWESEELFRTFFENAPDGNLILTPEDRVVMANQAVRDWLGYDAAELGAVPFSQFIHPDDRRGRQSWRELMLSGIEERSAAERRYLTKAGNVVWARTTKRLLRDSAGRPLRFVVHLVDITARKASEEQLRRIQELLNDTQNLARIGGWEYDLESRRLTWTDEVFRLHAVDPRNYDPNDVERAIRFYAPEDQPRIAEAFRRAVELGQPYDLELQLINAQQERLWVRVMGRAERQGQRITRVYGNLIDVTARKVFEQNLRASEARYRSLFEHMREAFAYCRSEDAGGGAPAFVFLAANPAFSRITGVSGIVGQRRTDVIPGFPEATAAVLRLVPELLRTGLPRKTEVAGAATGRWLDVSVYRVEADSFVMVFDDVTPRKQAEERIRRLNAELEARVTTRTAELSVANQELEAFAYSVAHDLRAPLRSVDGFSRVLLKDYAEKLDAEGRDSLERVRAATRRMGELIDDILKLSRVSRADMRRIEVSVTDIAAEILRELAATEPRPNVTPAVAAGLVANADPVLLRAVLQNLLQNAWKFTRDVAAPRIEVGQVADVTEPTFYVRDNGAGFDMTYGHKLFSPFQRLHDVAEFPGNGIGLATVHRIVRRHGGRVWAEGKVNEGATFYFTLPPNRSHP